MATKARSFTGIVYPDSAPADWKKQLEESMGMWLISPLHNPDNVNVEDIEQQDPDNGEGATNDLADMNKVTKPHYHVMYHHGNTIGWKAARSFFPEWIHISKLPNKFMVTATCNLARYFVHLDQKDKEQFTGKPEELLTVLNGFPLCLERQLTKAEERQLKLDIIALCDANNILEFAELTRFLIRTQDWQMFDYVSNHYGWTQAFLRSASASAKWKAEQEKPQSR